MNSHSITLYALILLAVSIAHGGVLDSMAAIEEGEETSSAISGRPQQSRNALVRFGRSPPRNALIRFGKRSQPISSEADDMKRAGGAPQPFVRFGKRSGDGIDGEAPKPFVRFGKRSGDGPEGAEDYAGQLQRYPVFGFGKRTFGDDAPTPFVRFGKRSDPDLDADAVDQLQQYPVLSFGKRATADDYGAQLEQYPVFGFGKRAAGTADDYGAQLQQYPVFGFGK